MPCSWQKPLALTRWKRLTAAASAHHHRAYVRKESHRLETRRRRIARQGEDHRKISRERAPRARLVRTRPRSSAQGWVGRSRRALRNAVAGVAGPQQAAEGHHGRGEEGRYADPRDR